MIAVSTKGVSANRVSANIFKQLAVMFPLIDTMAGVLRKYQYE
jgi:hypothetical protein